MSEALAYLDHNILDSMLKGDRFKVEATLKKYSLTPIYSDETLKEIKRSVGAEQQFLNLLNGIGAKYISQVTEQYKPTGKATVQSGDVHIIFDNFLRNETELPEFGYGLTGMVEKFYGGRADQSLGEIVAGGTKELSTLLEQVIEDLDDDMIAEVGMQPESEGLNKEQLTALLRDLPNCIEAMYQPMVADVDAHSNSPMKEFEVATKLGAKVLKNIIPPNVVEQVFEKVKSSMPELNLNVDAFFGIEPLLEEELNREKTPSEKVNAIYHQLNFLGYYRDSGMKKKRGFIRSSSDMTHAGMAAFCQFLFCSDEGLVKKAEAAYAYLDIGTIIVHYKRNK